MFAETTFVSMNNKRFEETLRRLLPPVLCLAAAGCLVLFMIETWRWPLVGDAVSVHYLIRLLAHGMAPYRQIVDAQMPGTYLVDWMVMHTFGGGRAALRVFDFALIVSAITVMIAIAWPVASGSRNGLFQDRRYAAFLAGCLFGIVHGRDGVEQSGQRDLIMAVLLLAAYALAFHALRRHRPMLLGLSGFCSTLGLTIKPTVLPAAYLILVLAFVRLKRLKLPMFVYLFAVCAGAGIPLAVVVIFLAANHSTPAFLDAIRGMWPYYANLQRRPVGYLLQHSFSPLAPLLVVWAAICLLDGVRMLVLRQASRQSREVAALRTSSAILDVRWEEGALYGGLVLCLASFILQGKGFVYHRYPFLAFLVLILMLRFQGACGISTAIAGNIGAKLSVCLRYLGALGMIVAALFIAPLSAYKISRFDWRNDDYYTQLSADLERLGGHALSGHVQCMDAFSGCISTLYRMDLVQSTGFLVDFYFFAPQPNAVVDDMRQHFWQDLQQNPPRVFVVSKQVFPVIFSRDGEPLDSYGKLQRWPAFNDYLHKQYTLVEEHEWSRPVLWASHADHPAGYRIYVRRP